MSELLAWSATAQLIEALWKDDRARPHLEAALIAWQPALAGSLPRWPEWLARDRAFRAAFQRALRHPWWRE